MWVQWSIQKLIQPFNLLTLRNVSPTVRCLARLKSTEDSKTEIPPPPKKPLITFFQFLKERRLDLQKTNPNLKMVEIVKLAAAEWSSLEDKSKYIMQYQKEHELYKKQEEHWRNSLTAHQKEAYFASRSEKREKLLKLRTKKQLHKLGKPKSSRSALNFYIKAKFEEKVHDKPTTAWSIGKGKRFFGWLGSGPDTGSSSSAQTKNRLMQLCTDWKNIQESEKEKYVAMAKDDKKRYEEEMKVWENQMMREGNEDLVRRKTVSSVLKAVEKAKPIEKKRKQTSEK